MLKIELEILKLSGACGYEDVVKDGYGLDTVALSTVLFNKGLACGACYEIKCMDSPQGCKPGQPSLFVTATDLCPPNYALPSDNGGWCNPPREHFDLAKPAYQKIADCKAGIVPVQYRSGVQVKGEGQLKWTELKRNWGQRWETNAMLSGETLTFRVTTSDGRCSTSKAVAPKGWQFGQTFVGKNLA
ncbi:hypothetical protein TSUD_200150 [Trifolium subterraneum]|nr:hypothetical protein TSUD_200150 [Trifolium subterraneum]